MKFINIIVWLVCCRGKRMTLTISFKLAIRMCLFVPLTKRNILNSVSFLLTVKLYLEFWVYPIRLYKQLMQLFHLNCLLLDTPSFKVFQFRYSRYCIVWQKEKLNKVRNRTRKSTLHINQQTAIEMKSGDFKFYLSESASVCS